MERATLVTGDFVRTGGMDMPNFALAHHLADRGVSVHLVAHRVAEELARHPQVHWHHVPKPLNSYFCGAPLLDRIGRHVAGKRRTGEARVVVNGGNCQVGDVNWVHYVHAAYQPTAKHGLVKGLKSRLARGIDLGNESKALRSARLVIVNSERTRTDLTTKLGIDDTRIRTVYYGIDAERFAPPTQERSEILRRQFGWNERPQVAFIGALSDRRKGFDTLYEAWAKLCQSTSWDCDLIVVGQGAELSAWRARAANDGLQNRVRFLGFRSDVPDILAASSALVAPTRYEAYGLGVHEALCIGVPALVSFDAGVAERYSPALSGLLLQDPNSASELQHKLIAWRQQTDELRRQTLELSRTLRKRTWETMAREIGELLN